jgi:hypothetical protein
LNFIDAHMRHANSGYIAASAPANKRGVFSQPVLLPDQNAALARAANMAHRYSDGACSMPVYEANDVAPAVRKALNPT